MHLAINSFNSLSIVLLNRFIMLSKTSNLRNLGDFWKSFSVYVMIFLGIFGGT